MEHLEINYGTMQAAKVENVRGRIRVSFFKLDDPDGLTVRIYFSRNERDEAIAHAKSIINSKVAA